MSWQTCATVGCSNQIRAGLRRPGKGADGQELADGRFCWRCRRRQTPTAAERRGVPVARPIGVMTIPPRSTSLRMRSVEMTIEHGGARGSMRLIEAEGEVRGGPRPRRGRP